MKNIIHRSQGQSKRVDFESKDDPFPHFGYTVFPLISAGPQISAAL